MGRHHEGITYATPHSLPFSRRKRDIIPVAVDANWDFVGTFRQEMPRLKNDVFAVKSWCVTPQSGTPPPERGAVPAHVRV
jgi:hypothetical protein